MSFAGVMETSSLKCLLSIVKSPEIRFSSSASVVLPPIVLSHQLGCRLTERAERLSRYVIRSIIKSNRWIRSVECRTICRAREAAAGREGETSI